MPARIPPAGRPLRQNLLFTAPPRRRVAGGARVGWAALAVVAALAVAGAPVSAQAPGGKPQEPTLLDAEQVVYDEQAGVVTATGAVNLTQGPRSVRADKIVYNRNTKVVTATGHVRLKEPSGDFVFADYAELTDDLKDAFVDNVRVLMTDNGRMAGNEGERRGGRLFRVNRGVYSPCDLCKDDPTRAPVWQVRAARVVHDKEEKDVRYRDAYLEMFGVPVAYTPYLSHPDPTVDRRSGFLAPSYGTKKDLGTFIRSSYYFDIAPDQDATLDMGVYTKQLPLLGGEYRKRFEDGRLQLNGAITQSELVGQNKVSKGDKVRGFVAAKGLFNIDDTWRYGIDAVRATDRSFLRKYYGVREDILTSRAFVEGFDGRNYAAVNAYSFQDMRSENTVHEPLVAPQAIYSALGEPGSLLGGRWSMEAQTLSLHRSGGPSMNRLTAMPGWRRDVYSSAGFITTAEASVLAAFYSYEQFDRQDVAGNARENGTQMRLFPRSSVSVRYPFVRYGESSQQIIEPKVALSFAPDIKNEAVPNEDSIDVAFDTTTLFMSSRYAGIDRLDTGAQATYGVRWAINGYKEGAASVFVGQTYRLSENTDYPTWSGLASKKSDYVTRVTFEPASWLDLDYRGRFDSENGRARVHSASVSGGAPQLNAYLNYSYRDQTPDQSRNALQHSSNATVGINAVLADRWTLGVAHVQAFSSDPGARATLGVLNYSDECLLFQTILRRDYTTDTSDSTEGSTLYFRLVFKNLGEFKSPGFGSLVFGGGSNSSK
jgi:LPS-assembly protein